MEASCHEIEKLYMRYCKNQYLKNDQYFFCSTLVQSYRRCVEEDFN